MRLELAVFFSLLSTGLACGAGGGGDDPFFFFVPVGGTISSDAVIKYVNNVIKNMFKGDLKVEEFNGANDGAISCPEDLDCSEFDGDCRWRNIKGDKWDYLRATGKPDPDGNWTVYMMSPEIPDDPFLLAISNQDDEANVYLASDPIPSQPDGGKLRMRLWKTPQVVVRACVRPPGGDIDSSKCYKPSEFDQTAAEAAFEIPGPINDEFELVMLTDNFALKQGGIAAIDDIRYESTLCGGTTSGPKTTDDGWGITDEETTTATEATTERSRESTTTQTEQPERSPSDICKLECDFESGPCGYLSTTGVDGFKLQRGPIGNRVTGIHFGKDGLPIRDQYIVAANSQSNVDDRIKHYAYSPEVDLSENGRFLRFHTHTARSGLSMKACVDGDTRCFASINDIQRRWIQREVELPNIGGRGKITFVVEDLNTNGYSGIDDIEVVDRNGQRIC